MKKITLVMKNNHKQSVNVVRYFELLGNKYLIYTLNEIDHNDYQTLYVVKEMKELGSPILQNIRDDEDWDILKQNIRNMIKELKNGAPVTFVDLNSSRLEGLYVADARIFKLAKAIVDVLTIQEEPAEQPAVEVKTGVPSVPLESVKEEQPADIPVTQTVIENQPTEVQPINNVSLEGSIPNIPDETAVKEVAVEPIVPSVDLGESPTVETEQPVQVSNKEEVNNLPTLEESDLSIDSSNQEQDNENNSDTQESNETEPKEAETSVEESEEVQISMSEPEEEVQVSVSEPEEEIEISMSEPEEEIENSVEEPIITDIPDEEQEEIEEDQVFDPMSEINGKKDDFDKSILEIKPIEENRVILSIEELYMNLQNDMENLQRAFTDLTEQRDQLEEVVSQKNEEIEQLKSVIANQESQINDHLERFKNIRTIIEPKA